MYNKMKKLTRSLIINATTQSKTWFDTNMIKLSDLSNYVSRDKYPIVMDMTHLSILGRIEFMYDDIHKHWAETDGITIWLNTYKEWTPSLLKYTLIHECIHGLVKRYNGHYLSEYKEHVIMELMDPKLV
jgi:hypothetical protein